MVTSAGILDGYRATKILFSKFYLIRQLEILVCSVLESGKGTYGRIKSPALECNGDSPQ